MKTFKRFIDAEKFAMNLSQKEKKSIPIVRKNGLFYVSNKIDDEYLVHSQFIFLIKNYTPKYQVSYHSKESGEHIDYFYHLDDAFKLKIFLEKHNIYSNIKVDYINLKFYNKLDGEKCKQSRENYLKKLRAEM